MDGEGDGETDEFSAVPASPTSSRATRSSARAPTSRPSPSSSTATPRSNIALLGGAGGIVNASRAAERVASDGYAAAVLGALVVCYAAVALARWLDLHTLYVAPAAVPQWARPGVGGWSWRAEVKLNVLAYHSLLRVYFAVPAHTAYSRAQLWHCLATNLTISASLNLLFLGVDQCTDEQVVVAGLLSGVLGSLLTTVLRIGFKRAGPKELKHAFKYNKRQRLNDAMFRFDDHAQIAPDGAPPRRTSFAGKEDAPAPSPPPSPPGASSRPRRMSAGTLVKHKSSRCGVRLMSATPATASPALASSPSC